MTKAIIAISQHGEKIILEGTHPRKELLEKMGASHAEKMYVDDADGNAKHVGYIIYGQWFRLYNLTEWTGK